MNFKIVDIKAINKNTLLGIFSLIAGPLKIEGWTYHVKDNKSWVGFPSRQFVDPESGESKYHPLVNIEDKDRYFKFQKWCKDQLGGVFNTPVPEPETQQRPTDESNIPF